MRLKFFKRIFLTADFLQPELLVKQSRYGLFFHTLEFRKIQSNYFVFELLTQNYFEQVPLQIVTQDNTSMP